MSGDPAIYIQNLSGKTIVLSNGLLLRPGIVKRVPGNIDIDMIMRYSDVRNLVSRGEIQVTCSGYDSYYPAINTRDQVVELIHRYGSLSSEIASFMAPLFDDELPSPDILLTDSRPNALADAINSASDHDVIIIDTDAVYNPVTITKPIIIAANSNRNVKINATGSVYGVLFVDGVSEIILHNLEIYGQQGSNTPGAFDNAGGICLQSPALVKNIVINKCYVHDCDEAGIQFQRTASVTTQPSNVEDLCRGIWITSCILENCSRVDNTENGGITIYDARDVFILGNQCFSNLRGVLVSNTIDAVVQGNWTKNNRYCGLKFDTVSSGQFPRSTGIIANNLSESDCVNDYGAGIRLDDMSGCAVVNNVVYNSGRDGILVEDDSDSSIVMNNIVFGCSRYGIRVESSVDRTLVFNNNSHSNDTDYLIEGSTPISISNISVPPYFRDPSNGDFTLQDKSPCLFAGYNMMKMGLLLNSFTRHVPTILTATFAHNLFTHVQGLRHDFFPENERSGSVEVSGSTSVDVAFRYPLPNNSYQVLCTPSADVRCWVTDKSSQGFTIHFSANFTGVVDWFVKLLDLA